METSVRHLLENIRPGESQRFERIVVTPLFDGTPENITYSTLSRALLSDSFKITEVSESGSVPNLRLLSNLDERVLLLDGEELTGARQNRVLNATILADARSELIIPVSCTEAGRWSYTSDRFGDSDVVMTARHRAAKSADVRRSLDTNNSYRSDQQAVWARVGDMEARLGVHSTTGAMRDAYAAQRPRLESFAEAFPCAAGQKGLAVTVDGRLLGLDFVSRPDAYADVHSRLVQSYAMEALLEPDGASSAPGSEGDLAVFIEQLVDARETKHKSVGCGWDFRYDGPDLAGSALVVEEEPVHVAVFHLESDRASSVGGERMAGYAQRARSRRRGGTDAE